MPTMRNRFAWALCLGLGLVLIAGRAPAAPQARTATDRPGQSPLREARQAVLVITDGWDTVAGTLQRFERADAAGSWKTVGSRVAAVVGKSGLAWGRGLRTDPTSGPVKKEGDGKAPAGVFRLADVFGQSAEKPASLAMPYRFLGDNVECVDDGRSTHYNELVTRQQVKAVDWTTSEKMWAEPLYKWGVVVQHNAGRPERSGGSCIFLHIWRGPASGTAGCTAMAESDLLALIRWLDAGKSPTLVQLPRREYERLKSAWGLPG